MIRDRADRGKGRQIQREALRIVDLRSQGVAKLAGGVTVEAVADDGLIEAFRVDADSFALAIQWHPEWRVTENPFATAIFKAFGDACRERAARGALAP